MRWEWANSTALESSDVDSLLAVAAGSTDPSSDPASKPLQMQELEVATGYGCNLAQWTRLLAHLSMRGLRVLKLPANGVQVQFIPQLLELIVGLPCLNTLRISASSGVLARSFQALPQLAALTSLDINEMCGSASDSCLAAVQRCLQLRELVIRAPALSYVSFHSFFVSSPSSLLQLRSLTLVLYSVSSGEASADEYRSVFSALKHLHTLGLRRVIDVDAILPFIACAPSLRRLELESDTHPSAIQGRMVPSPGAVARVLEIAPELRATLRLKHVFRHFDRECVSIDEEADAAQTVKADFASEYIAALGARFTLHSEYDEFLDLEDD
jgi:hypothetical protein